MLYISIIIMGLIPWGFGFILRLAFLIVCRELSTLLELQISSFIPKRKEGTIQQKSWPFLLMHQLDQVFSLSQFINMGVILLIGLGKLGPSVVAGPVLGVVCDNNLSKLVYSRKSRQAHCLSHTQHRKNDMSIWISKEKKHLWNQCLYYLIIAKES